MADPRDILGNHTDTLLHAEWQLAHGDGAPVNQPGWGSELFLCVTFSLHSEERHKTLKQVNSKIPRVEVHAGDPSCPGSNYSGVFPQQEIL